MACDAAPQRGGARHRSRCERGQREGTSKSRTIIQLFKINGLGIKSNAVCAKRVKAPSRFCATCHTFEMTRSIFESRQRPNLEMDVSSGGIDHCDQFCTSECLCWIRVSRLDFHVPLVFPQRRRYIWPTMRPRDTPVHPQRVPSAAVPSCPWVVVGSSDGPPRRPNPCRPADEGPPRHRVGESHRRTMAPDQWRAQGDLDRQQAAPNDPAAAIGGRHARTAERRQHPPQWLTVARRRRPTRCHQLAGSVCTSGRPVLRLWRGDGPAHTGGT